MENERDVEAGAGPPQLHLYEPLLQKDRALANGNGHAINGPNHVAMIGVKVSPIESLDYEYVASSHPHLHCLSLCTSWIGCRSNGAITVSSRDVEFHVWLGTLERHCKNKDRTVDRNINLKEDEVAGFVPYE